jgi:hypothetical protein
MGGTTLKLSALDIYLLLGVNARAFELSFPIIKSTFPHTFVLLLFLFSSENLKLPI